MKNGPGFEEVKMEAFAQEVLALNELSFKKF